MLALAVVASNFKETDARVETEPITSPLESKHLKV
jgi:hypothetical protein